MGRHPRQDQHAHAGDDHHPAAAAAQALSRGGRLPPQRLAQHLDDRPGPALRPEGQHVHGLRYSEVRYVSLYEKDGQMKVVLPSYRTRKVTVMSFRSEADIAAAKAQAAP